MTINASEMISRHFFNRTDLFWSPCVPSRMSAILNNKFSSWKEYKLLHVSSVSPDNKKNQAKLQHSQNKLQEVRLWNGITVKDAAQAFKMNLDQLARLLPDLAHAPDAEIKSISNLTYTARKLGYKIVVVSDPKKKPKTKQESHFVRQPPSKPENMVKRAPVVTVMGHVDHGKTTLLDSLRNSFVAQQEFGGITQHIGAFSVEVKPGERITFIDTPGHAAFTAMRSRGAETTDIVVLVIAVDDGIMEQTIESIRIVNVAQVPMIVAVNKIDKPTTLKVEDIKCKLLEEGIQVEDHGGDVQLVPISALKKINLDLLTEVILLQAELLNLKGDPTGLVEGVIIESKMDKLGVLATVIIKRGTLKKGKVLVAGTAFAKVRQMLDENGKEYKEAIVSTPVQISGWNDLPLAGDEVFEIETERQAKMLISERQRESLTRKAESEKEIIEKKAAEQQLKQTEYKTQLKSMSDRRRRRLFVREHKLNVAKDEESDDSIPNLRVLVKGDVFGSVEVLLEILSSYNKEDECKLSIVDASVGDITQNDLITAECFKAIIYAFNVKLNPSAAELQKDYNIDIHHHNVIYKLIDDVKEELSARIPPKDEEQIKGEAEVLQNFLINKGNKKVPVAGARCVKGQLVKDCLYRILRDDKVIYEGNLDVMKNEKMVVKSIPKGMECGLMFDSFQDKFQPGDRIICYEIVKVSRTTTWDPGF